MKGRVFLLGPAYSPSQASSNAFCATRFSHVCVRVQKGLRSSKLQLARLLRRIVEPPSSVSLTRNDAPRFPRPVYRSPFSPSLVYGCPSPSLFLLRSGVPQRTASSAVI